MTASSVPTNDREAELIRRVSRGEHKAFYELVRPCERAIYFAAMGVLGNSADAEEVGQETILKAFKALPNFRFEAKFSTWIIQTPSTKLARNSGRTAAIFTSHSIPSRNVRKASTAPGTSPTGATSPPKSYREGSRPYSKLNATLGKSEA
jgi:hypothetical protein